LVHRPGPSQFSHRWDEQPQVDNLEIQRQCLNRLSDCCSDGMVEAC
jgi:hypothetical protein